MLAVARCPVPPAVVVVTLAAFFRSGAAVAAAQSPGTTLASDTAAVADPLPFWGEIGCASTSRHQQITTGGDTHVKADGTSQGNTSLRRLTVIDGDDYYGERCELGENNHSLDGDPSPGPTVFYSEGDRRITYMSFRLPTGFALGVEWWQVVMQMKQTGPADNSGGTPVLALHAYLGRWRLQKSTSVDASSSTTELWSAAASTGVWTRFAFDVKYSKDPLVGWVKVYADLNNDGDFVDAGEASSTIPTYTLKRETAGTTADGLATGDPIPSHLRSGIYHNPSYSCPSPTGCYVDVDNIQVVDPGTAPDTTPPETTISSGPSGITTSTSASFGFSSSEAGSSFSCSLDGGAYSPCSSPRSYSALTAGTHTFRVKARDAAGNEDSTPAARTWEIDTSTYAATVRADSPQGYWRYNATSGSTAAPQVGAVSGTHGTGAVAGAATLGPQLGTAVDYSGAAGAETAFGDNFDFSGVQPFSVELWARPDTVDATYRRLLSKQGSTGGTQGYTLYSVTGVNGIGFQRFRDDVADTAKCPQLAPATTYHVVGTYDGATLRLYKNGVECGSVASTRSLLDHTGPFVVGNTSILAGRNFDGRLDEPAVYSRALAAAEVLEHYNAGP